MNTLFLDQLDDLLARGVEGLSPAFREAQVRYAALTQEPDGGFHGRQGQSDLYYTDFALRTLCLLAPPHPALTKKESQNSPQWPQRDAENIKTNSFSEPLRILSGEDGYEIMAKSADYLEKVGLIPQDIPAAFNLLNAHRLLTRRGYKVAVDLAELGGVVLQHLRAEGGFAAAPGGEGISAYQSFLGALALQMVGLVMPNPADAVQAVLNLRRADGGFAESPHHAAGQTNATAAAVAFLLMNEAFPQEYADRTAAFLAGMQAEDGGIKAHAEARGGDLLSTFTALLTLWMLGGMGLINPAALARFLRGAAMSGGGFRAGAADLEADVEYTYYGIGTMALLRLSANS